MVEFFSDNLGTIVVAAILGVIVAAAVVRLVKQRRSGACSCGNASCPHSDNSVDGGNCSVDHCAGAGKGNGKS